ncbi:sulfate transporter family-domain-containing protein [Protomyces lactucae-debilis]|uniref:Sulfate transporter family-domain-containing protein n=1 Tax=Protomyces lactucae-debilis TaxID=2754530 RepID=A0A1Y2FT45_PROLT|nr:sulfate transporter family-domain-containing protein [Protomyces lactucae-debilis]ORY87148.1 sulfate transporter family-domain-containing protein [Protomyces lactucae-debilis]
MSQRDRDSFGRVLSAGSSKTQKTNETQSRDIQASSARRDSLTQSLIGRSYYSASHMAPQSLSAAQHMPHTAADVRLDTQKLAARASVSAHSPVSPRQKHAEDFDPRRGSITRTVSPGNDAIEEVSEPVSPESTFRDGANGSGLAQLLRSSPTDASKSALVEQGVTEHSIVQTPRQMSENTALLSDDDHSPRPKAGRYNTAPHSPRDLEEAIEDPQADKNLQQVKRWAKAKMKWSRIKDIEMTPKSVVKGSTTIIGFLPAVVLGLLLNILDALSYGMILFPLGTPIFANLGADGISMFYVSCIISQLVFSLGGSVFKGGIGSEMIEVVPFFHQMALSIMADIGEDKPDAVIATTILAYAISSIVTGLVFFSLGYFKLGSLIGYFPRHILVGCIGGVGWFLFVTGLEVSARLDGNLEYSLKTLQHLFEGHTALLWSIPLGLAIILEILQRLLSHPLVVPLYFCAIPLVFYIVVAAVPSLHLETLREAGWVFEAPEAGKAWYDFYTLYKFGVVDWGALARTFPAMLALTFFGVLHVPINIPALGVSTCEDNVDVNRELKAHGVSNALSGMFGSIQNYLVYTNSILFIRCGGDSRVAGVMLSIGTAAIMFIGPTLVGKIPIMVVGALIFLLGMDLLKEALIDTIGKVHLFEYLTIVVIVVTMGVFDFVLGIVVGIILACIFFVVQTSKKSPIRAHYSGASAMSTVRRPPVQQRYLRDAGHQVQVYKLSGYMFFGSVSSVEKIVREYVEERRFKSHPIRFLVLDLTLANGMDFSAAEAFTRMRRLLSTRDIHLVICGCRAGGEIMSSLQGIGLLNEDSDVEIYDDLNSALEGCENKLLEAFYTLEEHMSPQTASSNELAVPQVNQSSLEMAHSPRGALLSKAATNTLSKHKQNAGPPSKMSFAAPLPLLLQVFQDSTDKREDFWHRVCPFFVREEVAGGKILWKEHTEATCFYVVESGMIRATYRLEAGLHVESITSGTVCGELPFLAGMPRTAQLVTVSDCVLWKLDKQGWDKMQQMPGGLELALELQKIGLRLTSERLGAFLSYGLT